ncbi:MAG: hypothetical protein KDB03_05015 [Planctomycetales bacterium]|nr:hypothetical protein [Planctomycetales bacterium]
MSELEASRKILQDFVNHSDMFGDAESINQHVNEVRKMLSTGNIPATAKEANALINKIWSETNPFAEDSRVLTNPIGCD